jgi:hypothetical protein
MDSFLEKLAEGWTNQEEATRNFIAALSFNGLYELHRSITSQRRLSIKVEKVISDLAKSKGLLYRNPCLLNSGLLMEQLRTVSIETALQSTDEQGSQIKFNVSGTGDGFTEKTAQEIAILELMERTSFKLGKYHFKFEHSLLWNKDRFDLPTLAPIEVPSTSGFALESTPIRAAQKAVLEAIERDAFLCHWYTQIQPEQIELKTLPLFRIVQKRCTELKLNFRAYRLETSNPQLWVIYLVAFDPNCRNQSTNYCSGLACSSNPVNAFMKAYFELDRFLGIHRNLQELKTRGSPPVNPFFLDS